MFIFRWEPVLYNSGHICDVEGHRLYVKRTAKGARTFAAYVDARPVRGTFPTVDLAKKAAEEELRLLDGVAVANAIAAGRY